MYDKLVNAKSLLVTYSYNIDKENYDSVEYLTDTIDYLILGKIPCNLEILNIILEDVMVCNSYQRSSYLTKVAIILSDIIREYELCMK